jgi:hypothetical protein
VPRLQPPSGSASRGRPRFIRLAGDPQRAYNSSSQIDLPQELQAQPACTSFTADSLDGDQVAASTATIRPSDGCETASAKKVCKVSRQSEHQGIGLDESGVENRMETQWCIVVLLLISLGASLLGVRQGVRDGSFLALLSIHGQPAQIDVDVLHVPSSGPGPLGLDRFGGVASVSPRRVGDDRVVVPAALIGEGLQPGDVRAPEALVVPVPERALRPFDGVFLARGEGEETRPALHLLVQAPLELDGANGGVQGASATAAAQLGGIGPLSLGRISAVLLPTI